MTPNQITLVRETWDKVAPIADTAAQIFYEKLFEIDPGAKRLFAKTDMKRQRGMLLDALGLVVQNAERPECLTPVLEELARRHVRYGVEDHHYTSVGIALIATLEQELGSAFTDEARAAWMAAYALVSGTMQHAAGDAVGAAA